MFSHNLCDLIKTKICNTISLIFIKLGLMVKQVILKTKKLIIIKNDVGQLYYLMQYVDFVKFKPIAYFFDHYDKTSYILSNTI